MSKYIKLDVEKLNEKDRIYGCIFGGYEYCEDCPLCDAWYNCAIIDWLESLPTIEVSEDCISREDLLKHAYKREGVLSVSVESIKLAPSVVPSRVQGHYIKGENGEWYCSNCKRIDDKYSVAKFCWYCGAKMKGTDDDS